MALYDQKLVQYKLHLELSLEEQQDLRPVGNQTLRLIGLVLFPQAVKRWSKILSTHFATFLCIKKMIKGHVGQITGGKKISWEVTAALKVCCDKSWNEGNSSYE